MRGNDAIRPVPLTSTARQRRSLRLLAAGSAFTLAVGGLSLAGATGAQATPGNGSYVGGAPVSTPHPQSHLAVDPYTGLTFTAGTGVVDVFDNYTAAVVRSITVGSGLHPVTSLAVDPARGIVWTANSADHSVSKIDESTLTVTSTVSLPVAPQGIAVDEVTGKAFVTTGTSGTIIPIDEASATAGTALSTGGNPTLIATEHKTGTIYALDATAGTVTVVSEGTFTVTATVPAQPSLSAIVVDDSHNKVYIASSGTNTLTVLNGADNTTSSLALPPVNGSGIATLAIDEATQSVFAESGSDLVTMDTTSGTMKVQYTAGAAWQSMDADPYLNVVVLGFGTSLEQVWEPISITNQLVGLIPQGTAYSQPLTAYVSGPVTWTLSSGALPTGLALSGSTISGTPTATGTFTFSITATDTTGDSVTQAYRQVVTAVGRVSGADRFATSVAVSQAAYPSPAHASTVYIASGYTFPDALAAGPAATANSGPLLLTAPDFIPAVIQQEITRLQPTNIVVVGGVNVVTDAVLNQLKTMAPNVTRQAGGDRYATARAVVQSTFHTAPTVYIATGANFPDSLSAGTAAGAHGAPLLLVNGGASAVDSDTAALLHSLGTTNIVIVGGPAVVSTAMAQSLAQFGTVTRYYGGDRFGTSETVNWYSFSSASSVLLASGLNFPDALGASAWGGKTGSPLHIAPNGCVPTLTLYNIYVLGATHVSLVGGPNALAGGVANLTPCQDGWTSFAPSAAVSGSHAPVASAPAGPSALLDHPLGSRMATAPRVRP